MKDDCDSILPPKVSPLSLRDPLINIKQTILSDRSSLRYGVLLYIPLFEILSISVNICSFPMISMIFLISMVSMISSSTNIYDIYDIHGIYDIYDSVCLLLVSLRRSVPQCKEQCTAMYMVFFFTGPPLKKYGKLRLGEVRCI